MAGYDHAAVEAKWREYWVRNRTFATPKDRSKPKYYVLDMFPYPSGAGLHVGHPKGYVATDVVARARRMMGFHVLRVMGWDSFGLPAERQAVKEGVHPRVVTDRNIAYFKEQLSNLGLSYDWDHELATSDPRYYRWTQWIFLKLYEKGLAYEAQVPVNWCPAEGTVLSNEEVKDGRYVETGAPVERRMMKQWMLRITVYADRLVDDLEGLDWPEGIKQMQRDWIGRSEGAEVRFDVASGGSFEVFTTRPDTLFGCTFVVLAPEHELVLRITTPEQRAAVDAYRAAAARQADRDRLAQAADAPKTGVWTGAFAVNPVNGEPVPVWIADYVLLGYGTGAVFACPAGDERDHAFAKTFGLPIREVVKGPGDRQESAWPGDGPHVNSGFLDGLDTAAAKRAVIAWLEQHGMGRGKVQYRLRDWLFSRQRYWGEPFPLLHAPDGRVVTVSEDELPVELPDLDEYRPTDDGRPPLARAGDWVRTQLPDGTPADRETNTMPQWAGSCWYYLRFVSPWDDAHAWHPDEEKYWMPVDLYVGGAEHAVLHLLYARFWHKVLYDLGLVGTKEPFQRLFNQGMVHATAYNDSPDGRGKFYYPDDVEPRGDAFVAKADGRPVHAKVMKMSKSRYNVTNPDDICRDFGADALRLYELFMGPLEDGALWEDSGVAGTRRFLDKAWRLFTETPVDEAFDDRAVERALHAAIKKVTEAVENLRFNTAVSEMMIFVNEALRAGKVRTEWKDAFARILAPFAPHLGEEMWQRLGHAESLTFAPWPVADEAKLATDTIVVAVQVNGKLRGQVSVAPDTSKEAVLAAARAEPNVARHLAGATVRREVYVPGRLVNLVVG